MMPKLIPQQYVTEINKKYGKRLVDHLLYRVSNMQNPRWLVGNLAWHFLSNHWTPTRSHQICHTTPSQWY